LLDVARGARGLPPPQPQSHHHPNDTPNEPAKSTTPERYSRLSMIETKCVDVVVDFLG